MSNKGQWGLNWPDSMKSLHKRLYEDWPTSDKGGLMSGGIESMHDDWKKNYKDSGQSSSNELVVHDLCNRALFGLGKYGKFLDKNTNEDMLQHLYEELLDAAVYIRTLLEQRKHG